jgi:proline iminopeptidase
VRATVREGYVTTSDSARLFYRVMGQRGDTLIAIHGGPGVDLESIVGDFAPLAGRHVVIFYDQRGAGRSELPKDTSRLFVKRQIADLDEVRRHFGVQHVTLVAHSYGPLFAASYALAHPEAVRRMVFFGPVPPRRGDFWKRFGASMNQRLDPAAAPVRLTRAAGSPTLTRTRVRHAVITGRSACVLVWRSRIVRCR